MKPVAPVTKIRIVMNDICGRAAGGEKPWRYTGIVTDRLPMDADDNALGAYLKDCRRRLDPAAFGFPPERRRTPGSGARRSRCAPR